MRYLKEWPHLLLTFPNKIRLALLSLSFLLCVSTHILTFPISHNGGLLAPPIGLAAWMFKKRGLFACVAAEIVVLFIYQTMRQGNIWWPLSSAIFFWGGFLLLLFIGYIIIILRDLVDSAEAAQRQTAVAYEQQLQLNQLKNHFIINVNHELRTPLTALYGYLELFQFVLQQQGQMDRATYGPPVERALAICEELRSAVNNALDTLKIGNEGEVLVLEDLPVARVVSDLVNHIDAVKRRRHSISLEIPEYLTVRANAQCMHHVLRHLLSNAFKYSPPDTQVIVSADLTTTSPQQNNATPHVCISVKDTGPGISQAEIPLLFGQFVRLQRDLAGKERGTGLGLYISKSLVEAMGGHIWVESAGIPGQGSRFCFTLPYVRYPTLPT